MVDIMNELSVPRNKRILGTDDCLFYGFMRWKKKQRYIVILK